MFGVCLVRNLESHISQTHLPAEIFIHLARYSALKVEVSGLGGGGGGLQILSILEQGSTNFTVRVLMQSVHV